MDTEEMRQYIARVHRALDEDGYHAEGDLVIMRAPHGWAVRLRLGWLVLPDRECAVRAFICGLRVR
jgi:hypothetical protein